MTGTSMPESFDQISAAIPRGTFAVIPLKRCFPEKQDVPPGNDEPEIERKTELVCRNRVVNGGLAHQKRIKRVDIVIRCLGEMVVRKSGIEPSALTIDALVHRAPE